MILKAAGMAMVFVVCTAMGLISSTKFSKRVRQLEELIGSVSFISTEIRYFASPIQDILIKIIRMPEYKNLKIYELCSLYFKANNDFNKSWQTSLVEARGNLALNDTDYEALKWFGTTLGATDVEGQIANCARCEELLTQRLNSAREDRRKKGRMYSSMGVLAGIFFIVMFI